MISKSDAWHIRRILTGTATDGEAQAVSEAFRLIAQRIETLRLEDRNPAWSEFVAALPDSRAVTIALSEAIPDELRSDQSDDESEWQPLRFTAMPPAEPFPVDVLPTAVARLVTEGAAAIGCPPDFLALPALAVAGGVIGRSVSLLLKPGYFAGTSLFAASVGPPSDGKTPALKIVSEAVRRIDDVLRLEHDQTLERWKDESEKSGPEGKKLKPLPAPKPRRIVVDDITMESLVIRLSQNPRGLLRINDELTAFILGFNQYKSGGGNDRSIALKMWSSDAITRDRVGNENNLPIHCAHPCMSMIGGLPPDMLGALLDPSGRADGLPERFLYAFPEPLPIAVWSETGVPKETTDDWCDLVARLWERPMSEKDGRVVPAVSKLTPEARAAWEIRYNSHIEEMNAEDFPPILRGTWGKFREYFGRLVLILACLRHAVDPTADPSAIPEVGPRVVEDAWRLLEYFKAHTRRVRAAIERGTGVGGNHVVKAIVDWLRQGQTRSFSEHKIKQARRWISDDDLQVALKYLMDRNAITTVATPKDQPKGGRPHSPVYEVNPALLATQNTQNSRNPEADGQQDGAIERIESFEKGSRRASA